MKKLLAKLLGPRGHAGGSALLLLVSQFFPEYAGLIQAIAGALGYSAAVSPSPKR